ncbi:MAG: helix-turn-helix transcriptional regulator [Blautia sp.]|nr:helix-turn-helix transcriptional regulator [Blautia sp.]
MFDHIPLVSYRPDHVLSSGKLTEKDLDDTRYERENLSNTKFVITGSVDSLALPPMTPYAKEHLNHFHAFGVFHYVPPSFTERKNYHSFLIAYTYGGKGVLEYHGKTYHLSKGDGFFINCTDPHLYKAVETTWDVAIIHIRGPLLEDMHRQFLLGESAVFHDPIEGEFQKKLEKILTLYSSPQPAREWQISSAISDLVTFLIVRSITGNSGNPEVPQHIRYLVKYMESNYKNRLTLDDLAEFANFNKYYLLREFKKYTGFSPNDYLISLRIGAAKQLLVSTTLPASKIAYEVGISDVNNFNNLFKKRVGMTPIQYRRSSSFFV